MFRYVIALLLVTTYSSSSVVPTPRPNGSLANLLDNLANDCKNPFVSSQVKAKIDECNLVVSQYNEKEFECLIFYDINSQLCKAVSASKIDLKGNYTSTINEEINIEKLCEVASNWTFGGVPSFPNYDKTVATVFNTKVTCLKVCGVDDVTSQDTNFFCKYYKWGFQVLKSVNTPSQPNVELPSNVAVVSDVNNVNAVQPEGPTAELGPSYHVSNQVVEATGEIANAAKVMKAEIRNSELPASAPAPANLDSTNEGIDKPSAADIAPAKTGDEDQKKDTAAVGSGQVEQNSIKKSDTAAEDGVLNLIKNAPAGDKVPNTIKNSDPGAPNNDIEIPNPDRNTDTAALAGDPGVPNPDRNTDTAAVSSDHGVLNPVKNPDTGAVASDLAVPNPIRNTDTSDDYQDGEDGREGLPDGGDDGDDPVLGEMDTKLEANKNRKKTDSAGEREFYHNPMPDGYSDADDDHFFPFFLTAVIIVVVLYVLYHNKSKVSKVFLGLIVEGRQSGRRRNSRGHAYRRLDTLEQAMSTNSAAPPSKIIY